MEEVAFGVRTKWLDGPRQFGMVFYGTYCNVGRICMNSGLEENGRFNCSTMGRFRTPGSMSKKRRLAMTDRSIRLITNGDLSSCRSWQGKRLSIGQITAEGNHAQPIGAIRKKTGNHTRKPLSISNRRTLPVQLDCPPSPMPRGSWPSPVARDRRMLG